MKAMNNRQSLSKCKRLVIKIGSSQIIKDGSVRIDKIKDLARLTSELMKNGREIIIVTSGAVGAGISKANLQVKKTLSIPYKQAAAAIGQTSIMQAYAAEFSKNKIHTGQILLTKQVMENRETFINAKNTFNTLIKIGAVPIVNENDTVAVDELKVGDNDKMAAMVSQLTEADLLIVLSDIDGFYRDYKDPEKRELISTVNEINKDLKEMAGTENSHISTGGMITKLIAAELAMIAGIPMVLANGTDFKIITDILNGNDIGTLFVPKDSSLTNKKYWLMHHLQTRGTVILDDGAVEAIKNNGKSLLPKGIIEVSGNFHSGEGIELTGKDKEVFAIGITNYGSSEIEKIKRQNSSDIENILGYKYFDEVVHRDNLVLKDDK